jgi:hypothetical protein
MNISDKTGGVALKEKIVIGSVTYAIKAKKEVEARGLSTRVVKASQKETKGCSYALEIEAKDRLRVYAILDELAISYQR